ncbi:SDR family NAD(P)-dependent oxidoreductase [Thermocatellispora tengchongensis]|uniref:SDR family NAD(P)-dependent oxidoreductase n=1 Tax=Thermocatellispora tengchongensis TaxID=1073253 RepID=UPI00363D9A33
MTGIEGKVALVTGASSGLGEHIARVLAGRGATVIGAARRAGRIPRLACSSPARGGSCRWSWTSPTGPPCARRYRAWPGRTAGPRSW